MPRLRLPRGPLRIGLHATLATLLLVTAAVWRFDIPAGDMVALLGVLVLAVVVLSVPAAACGWLLRRFLRRRR